MATPNEPRLQVRDLVLTCCEPQYRSAQEATPRTLAITTMSATAGTFISPSLNSTHVGNYVIAEDGDIRGQIRQIVNVVVATTTATVDVPWTSSTSVTSFRSWLPADVPVRATATGTTTTVASSPHANITNEADSFWSGNGYYLLGKKPSTSNTAGVFKISSFVSTTGVYSVVGDSFGGAPVDGELFLARKMIRPESPVTATVDRKTISRRVQGFRSADQQVVITSEGSVELNLAQRPLTASAGSGVTATPPFEMGDLLRDFMTQTLDVGSTITSSGSGTLTPVGGTFSVGGFVLLTSGEASQVEASSGGVLTVPAITAAGVAASNVYASSWYQTKTSTFFTRMFDIYRGRIERQIFHGCVPSVELQISRDQVIKFNFKYSSGEAWEYKVGDPNTLSGHLISLLDTTVPVDGKGARVRLGAFNVLVGDLKINFGPKPLQRMSLSGANQNDGFAFDFEPVKLTMTGYLADNDDTTSIIGMSDMLNAGNPVRFFYQKGTAPKETFCAAIPALGITKSVFNHENGEGAFSLEGEAIQPQAVRGNSASTSLGDFAMGWL